LHNEGRFVIAVIIVVDDVVRLPPRRTQPTILPRLLILKDRASMTPARTIDYREPETSWHHQRRGGGDRKGDDGKHGHKDWWERLLSLEGTRTLTDQHFDVALVCPEEGEGDAM